MAVHITAETIVRYSFHSQAYGRNMANVLDVSIDASTVDTQRDDAVDDVNSHICGIWQDHIVGLMDNNFSFLNCTWVDLHDVAGRTGVLGPAGGHPVAGTANFPTAPINVCTLVHKNTTAHRGQKSGRWYFSSVAEGDVGDNGMLAGGAITSWGDATNGILDDVRGLSTGTTENVACRVVHVHKVDKNNPSTWTWTSSDITSCTVDPMVATQRKRLR